MADPLSISVSALAILTAAIQSTNSLCAAVGRYKKRDKTLNRLQGELEDLLKVLDSLRIVVETGLPILKLLESPVARCSQVCGEFEAAMGVFDRKSSTGLRDWARMEFMKGDINDFMDTLASYKSTIMIGLGTINMQHAKLSHELLEEYNDKIQDTAHDLEVHLQRIDEKLERIESGGTNGSHITVDLQDERAVTEQCLRICQEASAYIDALQEQQPGLLKVESIQTPNMAQAQFEAQRITSQTLNENRNKFMGTISSLQERLMSITSSEGPESDRQRDRLLRDIDATKKCLEVCNQASEQVHYQKIHTIGEVIADDDTDQVVVTTLADLFDVRKVVAKNRSAQLVGSTTDETLQKMSSDRYNSRFGTLDSTIKLRNENAAALPTENSESNARPSSHVPAADRGMKHMKPSANEMRRRGS